MGCKVLKDLSIPDFGVCGVPGTNPRWLPRDNCNYIINSIGKAVILFVMFYDGIMLFIIFQVSFSEMDSIAL